MSRSDCCNAEVIITPSENGEFLFYECSECGMECTIAEV